MTKSKFSIGDKVVLKDYKTVCNIRGVSEFNEIFKRHYDYIKSKEPLVISYIYYAGELYYSEEDDNISRRKTPTRTNYYNIQTPRSKLYLFAEEELEEYVKNTEDD